MSKRVKITFRCKTMKKIILTLFIGICAISAFSQVTDKEIVNALLGKSIYRTNPTLDSLGVWNKYHPMKNNQPNKHEDYRARIYSIADGKGSVKVFFLKVNNEKIINEVTINYRHDVREQVEDVSNIKDATSINVGYYSTDVVYKL